MICGSTASAKGDYNTVDEWPEWVQPTGAQDAYMAGDKVSYNGKHYICIIDYNIYAPDVYGWEEA